MKFAEHSQEVMISRGLTRQNYRDTMPKLFDFASIDLAAINVVGPPFPNCYVSD